MTDKLFEDDLGLNKNEIDIKIANTLEFLVKAIDNITEFNQNELKAISILQTDYRIKRYLSAYLSNKKHIKRKHSDELIKALKTIALCVSHQNDNGLGNLDISDKKFFGRGR